MTSLDSELKPFLKSQIEKLFVGFSQLHDNDVNQFGMADMRGEPWKKMKRQLTPSFSTPRLKKNVDTINEQALKVRNI